MEADLVTALPYAVLDLVQSLSEQQVWHNVIPGERSSFAEHQIDLVLHLSDFKLDEVINVAINRLHRQVLLLFELLLQQLLLFIDFVGKLPVHPVERVASEVEFRQVEHAKAVEE